jgi:hypothetical protein
MMNRCEATVILGAAACSGLASASSPALAQTPFQNYRCADGSQFVVGFFHTTSAPICRSMAKAVTLGKRLALSGSRYSGRGVTLTNHQGRHHGQARQAAGDGLRADMKKGRTFFRPFLPSSRCARAAHASSIVVRKASALPHRLGFLDRRRVIPGAAAGDLARA